MPRFANYNHGAPSPSPVLGWYDTEFLSYPNLPDSSNLLEITDDAVWEGRTSGTFAVANGALVPYTAPPPALSPDQAIALALSGRLAIGIAITSTGTPGISATYALDPLTMDQIGSVARDAASGLGFPGGAPTFTYPDIAGTPRTFSEAQLIALYKAQRDLLFRINSQLPVVGAGGTPTWPTQTATIL